MKKYFGLVAAVAGVVGFANAIPNVASAQIGNVHSAHSVDVPKMPGQLPPVIERIPEGYFPLGLRWGSFVFNPKLEADLNYNDNIFYDNNRKESDEVLDLTPRAELKSDWDRHSLSFLFTSTIDTYVKQHSENSVSWDLTSQGRLDIIGDSNLFGTAEFARTREGRDIPEAIQDTAKPIYYDTRAMTLGYVGEWTRFRFTGEADYRHLNYNSVALVGGGVEDLNARDFSMWVGSGKLEYGFGPGTALYVDFQSNTRNYDSAKDRNSSGTQATVGARFNLDAIVRGDLQIGYMKQNYANPLFRPSQGPAFLGEVDWSPTPLTDVTFNAARSIEESPTIGASGFVRNYASVRVDHELLRQLVLTGSLTGYDDRYNGIDREDKRFAAALKGKYLITNQLFVRAEYVFAKLDSLGSAGLNPYTDNRFLIGLGWQY